MTSSAPSPSSTSSTQGVPALQQPIAVTYNRYCVQVNNKPVVIRSAALHYFKLAGPAVWKDRLQKLKAAGYNTIDLYIAWSVHVPEPGHSDFTGLNDLPTLLQLTQELGLWVIIRPGPYINAELSGGGLPQWLLARDDRTLRCLNADNQHQWCPVYMKAVEDWWRELFPYFAKAPNLLMVQVENEASSEGMEPDYIQALVKLARELLAREGVSQPAVPLFVNDVYQFGCFAEEVELYAFDHYPTRDLATDWRENPAEMLAVMDEVAASVRPYCENRPLFIAELQAGWFSGWQQPPAEAWAKHLGGEHLRLLTKTALAQGVTVFNHYMAVGGTHWGNLGSTETQSSYDFAAPISEAGALRPAYYEAKAFNQFLETFNLSAFDAVSAEEVGLQLDKPELLYKVLKVLPSAVKPVSSSASASYWVVLRNLKQQPVPYAITLKGLGSFQGSISALDVVFLPLNITLNSGHTVVFSTCPLLLQTQKSLLLYATYAGELLLQAPLVEGVALQKTVQQRLTIQAAAADVLFAGHWQGLQVLALGQNRVKTTWQLEEELGTCTLSCVVLGGSEPPAWNGNGLPVLGFSHTGEVEDLLWKPSLLSTFAANPELLEQEKAKQKARFEKTAVATLKGSEDSLEHWQLSAELSLARAIEPLPLLKNWQVTAADPTLSLSGVSLANEKLPEGFNSVQRLMQQRRDDESRLGQFKFNRLDFDALGFADESVWYAYQWPAGQAMPLAVELSARHFWAAYLNETFVGQGLSFEVDTKPQAPPVESLTLPATAWKPNSVNTLWVWCNSLGHPKGFLNDADTAGGLHHLRFTGTHTAPTPTQALIQTEPSSFPLASIQLPVLSGNGASKPLEPLHQEPAEFTDESTVIKTTVETSAAPAQEVLLPASSSPNWSQLFVAKALEATPLPRSLSTAEPSLEATLGSAFVLATAGFSLTFAQQQALLNGACLGFCLQLPPSAQLPWLRVDCYGNGKLLGKLWQEGSTQTQWVWPNAWLQGDLLNPVNQGLQGALFTQTPVEEKPAAIPLPAPKLEIYLPGEAKPQPKVETKNAEVKSEFSLLIKQRLKEEPKPNNLLTLVISNPTKGSLPGEALTVNDWHKQLARCAFTLKWLKPRPIKAKLKPLSS